MLRRLVSTVFLVLVLSSGYAPTAGSADGVPGLILSGSAESPVKLEVFSDFECPACGYFFLNTARQVLKNYGDKVCLIYYEFPLDMHKYARPAARYVSAAARLGDRKKLLTLFEALFTDQSKWSKNGDLETYVAGALSPEDFQKMKSVMETDGAGIDLEIERDIQVGEAKKIEATPTIFLIHAGKQERVVMPSNITNMYTLLSWRLNGLLGQ